nr:MAG TPA: envelope glycoprotein [Caudoviricetes sp.]
MLHVLLPYYQSQFPTVSNSHCYYVLRLCCFANLTFRCAPRCYSA